MTPEEQACYMRDLELADLKFITETPQGERFLERLIFRLGKFYEVVFTGSSRDTFFLGARSVVEPIVDDLRTIDPHILARMELNRKELLQRYKPDQKQRGGR